MNILKKFPKTVELLNGRGEIKRHSFGFKGMKREYYWGITKFRIVEGKKIDWSDEAEIDQMFEKEKNE